MVTSLAKYAENLSKNLILLRYKKKLTQAALARLSGATRASIALIESGTSNPSLETLMKLALALQVPIDELISSPIADCKLILAKDIPIDKRSKNGVILKRLLPEKLRSTELDELILDEGATLVGSPHIEGTKEYFTCVEGEITICVLQQIFPIKKGDVLIFPGDRLHSYKNLGKKKAKGISVVFYNPGPFSQ